MSILSNRFMPRTILSLAAALFFLPTSFSSYAQKPYKIVSQWNIGGSGTWDYLANDPQHHALYVTHLTSVAVLDTTNGKLLTTITGFKKAHGIAFTSDGNTGYISDGLSNDIVVFDRHNYKPLATIPTGHDPDGITFDPVTKTVWAFNGKDSTATVINTATNKVIATIGLPGKPEFPVADGQGSVYDNLESTGSIVRLDVRTLKVTSIWKLAGCVAPTGLALDPAGRRLFTVCDNNRMAIVNADTGKELGSAPIGNSPDATRFSPRHQLAFSSNGGGTLTVVDAAHGYKVIEILPTPKGAASMAYDEATDRIFLSVADYGPVPAADRPPAVAQVKSRHPGAPMIPESFHVVVIARN
jgi:YVTN family beta-propeller protein